MVGLLSGIDAIFNLEKSVVLNEVALDKELLDAIMTQSGELGSYLTQTLDCEGQNWHGLEALQTEERTHLNRAFLDAMVWTDEIMTSIS